MISSWVQDIAPLRTVLVNFELPCTVLHPLVVIQTLMPVIPHCLRVLLILLILLQITERAQIKVVIIIILVIDLLHRVMLWWAIEAVLFANEVTVGSRSVFLVDIHVSVATVMTAAMLNLYLAYVSLRILGHLLSLLVITNL